MNEIVEWVGTVEELNKDRGVYAIWDGTEIIYVGSTKRPFIKRYSEHCVGFKEKSSELKLYSHDIKEKLYMRPLICLDKIECIGYSKNTLVRNREWMEWALILFLKPKYNIAGLKAPFIFQKAKNKKRKKKKLESAF